MRQPSGSKNAVKMEALSNISSWALRNSYSCNLTVSYNLEYVEYTCIHHARVQVHTQMLSECATVYKQRRKSPIFYFLHLAYTLSATPTFEITSHVVFCKINRSFPDCGHQTQLKQQSPATQEIVVIFVKEMPYLSIIDINTFQWCCCHRNTHKSSCSLHPFIISSQLIHYDYGIKEAFSVGQIINQSCHVIP